MRILDIDQDSLKQVLHLLPNEGIGNVRFGMNPAQVRSNFPEEETYEDWMGGNLNDALLFRGIIFLFDSEDSFGPLPDSKMTTFIVRGREDVYLGGSPIEWWTLEQTTELLEVKGINFRTKFVPSDDRLKHHIDWASFIEIGPHSVSLKFTEQGELLELSASIF